MWLKINLCIYLQHKARQMSYLKINFFFFVVVIITNVYILIKSEKLKAWTRFDCGSLDPIQRVQKLTHLQLRHLSTCYPYHPTYHYHLATSVEDGIYECAGERLAIILRIQRVFLTLKGLTFVVLFTVSRTTKRILLPLAALLMMCTTDTGIVRTKYAHTIAFTITNNLFIRKLALS